MFFKNKLLAIFFSLFFISNLYAKNFEAVIQIEEVNNQKITIYNKKEKVIFSKNLLNKDLKYNKALALVLNRIMTLEQGYKDKELYEVESFKDENGLTWTISCTVTAKDESVTQFISSQDKKTISGWVNRNNKDIFGLRIFNY